MTDSRFDLIVLGTGTAATGVAMRCRKAGWRVAVVGEAPFGGTCALRGCEPKKTLWTVAEAADRARRLQPMGLTGGAEVGIDWAALQAFKRTFTDPVPERRQQSLAEAGIETFTGTARFIGPETVEVEGTGGLEAGHIVVATGAVPAPLRIEGAEHLRTSDEFLDLAQLPRRLLFVGGGYISFEFAHIAARAGAEVTILHEDRRPLAHFEPDLVDRLLQHSRDVGIEIELDATVQALQARGEEVVAHIADGRVFIADMAVHGAGRVPNLAPLDLAAGGIEVEKGRIRLDGHLRSVSNPNVFAAGDAAAKGPPLTPVASHDAECVARNLLEGCRHQPEYRGTASVVFTIPPLTAVGLSEAEARERGGVEVRSGDMSTYQSVRRTGEPTAAFKIILEARSGCVLGAHLLGPQSEEVINLFALAVRLNLPATDLTRLLSAYPSFGSNLGNMLG